MLSKSAEYALRAMIHLARHADEQPLTGTQIAAATKTPPKYLSKIMADLVRAGVLAASRGVGGGFRMVRGADQTTLMEVLAPFEPAEDRGACLFASAPCGARRQCPSHPGWAKVRRVYAEFLTRTTVHQVAFGRNPSESNVRGGARAPRQ